MIDYANIAPTELEPGPAQILLVEDDIDLRIHIAQYLAANDFIVHEAGNAKAMAVALQKQQIDLIILDIMLPGEDGLSICRRLSRGDAPPIVVVSAMGEEVDRVIGLELGADDYLPKPCSPRELLARIRAVLRRRRDPPNNGVLGKAIVTFNSFALDVVLRQLTAPDGTKIILTNGEFALLSAFLAHPRRVLSREELVTLAHGNGAVIDRAVDVQISRLRRKLQSFSDREMIRTFRGEGYLFENRAANP